MWHGELRYGQAVTFIYLSFSFSRDSSEESGSSIESKSKVEEFFPSMLVAYIWFYLNL